MYGIPAQLADTLAWEVLCRHRANEPSTDPPWLNLHRLAAAIGVESIQHCALLEEGRIEPAGDRFRVWISDDLPAERARFTLAHELAHLIFMSTMAEWEPSREVAAAFTSEEAMCDTIAAGFLMPRPWVLHAYGRSKPSLAAVRSLATSAGVSLSAAIIRFRVVLGWRDSLLHWTYDHGEWLLDGEAGLFTSQMRLVRNSELTGWQLNELLTSDGQDHDRRLSLYIGGTEQHVDAQVSVRSNSAVAFVRAGQIEDPSRGVRMPHRAVA